MTTTTKSSVKSITVNAVYELAERILESYDVALCGEGNAIGFEQGGNHRELAQSMLRGSSATLDVCTFHDTVGRIHITKEVDEKSIATVTYEHTENEEMNALLEPFNS